jgi:hypothetical protein
VSALIQLLGCQTVYYKQANRHTDTIHTQKQLVRRALTWGTGAEGSTAALPLIVAERGGRGLRGASTATVTRVRASPVAATAETAMPEVRAGSGRGAAAAPLASSAAAVAVGAGESATGAAVEGSSVGRGGNAVAAAARAAAA